MHSPREGFGGTLMRTTFDSWLRDIVLSCRGLRRQPVFVFVAVASLALGIGGNALVFSVVNSVLLRPLAFPDADRLVAVWLTPPNEPEQRFGTNTGVYFTTGRSRASARGGSTNRSPSRCRAIPRRSGFRCSGSRRTCWRRLACSLCSGNGRRRIRMPS